MSEQTVIKADGAAGFLGLVPALLGYQPQESVVLIPFTGSRTVGAMRFDIPAGDYAEIASTMSGYVCRLEGVDGVAIITYTAGAAESTKEAMRALIPQFDRQGIRIIDALYVGADGWRSDHAVTVDLHSLDEIPAGSHGYPVRASQTAAVSIPEVDESVRDLVLAITMDELEQALALDFDLIEFFESMLDGDDSGPLTWAMLAMLLKRPATRDILIVQACGGTDGGRRALQAQLAWEEGTAEYPADLAMRMWGEGARPDPKRLEQLVTLGRYAAAYTTESEHGGALSLAAWGSWALGRSSHAQAYVDLALAGEPGHGLSEIVASFVTAGHLPAWAFAR